MHGQIVKAVGGKFDVKADGKKYVDCIIRGTAKRYRDIFVGDYCELSDGIITKIYDRKNELIRPYVANIDVLIIVVAPVPVPDWTCVEKLILNCRHQSITPAVLLNKCDLADKDARERFLTPYKDHFTTFCVSAKTNEGIEELKSFIKGKLVCFAGQSAVGKSSLINAIGGDNVEVGELSKKVARGKNTTRHVEIYDLAGGEVADTCGFTFADNVDIKPEELVYYYDEFLAYQNECRYNNCTHTNEPGCAVKKAVEEKKLNEDRYFRYVALYESLKEVWRTKYD